MSVSKKNAEGYQDPTPYEALTRIQKEERIKTFRPLVFICSPYSGDIEANVIAARKYCKFAVDTGYIPIAPHLLYTQFMDDQDDYERKLGLRFGEILMDRCAEVWVFGSQVSSGMKNEISRAQCKGYPLRFFTTECKEVMSIGSYRHPRSEYRI